MRLEYDLAAERSWGEVDIVSSLAGVQVDIVASQKVIGWETRRSLERSGVQVIDRLGTIGMGRLRWLTEGREMSSVTKRVDLGQLDTMENIEVVARLRWFTQSILASHSSLVRLVGGSM